MLKFEKFSKNFSENFSEIADVRMPLSVFLKVHTSFFSKFFLHNQTNKTSIKNKLLNYPKTKNTENFRLKYKKNWKNQQLKKCSLLDCLRRHTLDSEHCRLVAFP